MYVIVTNHINWHRENLQSKQGKNRENTGNMKMQFEWVPCFNKVTVLVFRVESPPPGSDSLLGPPAYYPTMHVSTNYTPGGPTISAPINLESYPRNHWNVHMGHFGYHRADPTDNSNL